MLKNIHYGYILRIWVTTILVTPILFILLGWLIPAYSVIDDDIPDGPIIIIQLVLIVGFGLVFSAPALLVFGIVVETVLRKKMTHLRKKIIIAGMGVLSIFITFLVLLPYQMVFLNVLYLTGLYSAVLIASVFLYKIEPANADDVFSFSRQNRNQKT